MEISSSLYHSSICSKCSQQVNIYQLNFDCFLHMAWGTSLSLCSDKSAAESLLMSGLVPTFPLGCKTVLKNTSPVISTRMKRSKVRQTHFSHCVLLPLGVNFPSPTNENCKLENTKPAAPFTSQSSGATVNGNRI